MEKDNKTVMKCGCIIEFINGKHIITHYCPEHDIEDDDFDSLDDPKFHKIRKFTDDKSI